MGLCLGSAVGSPSAGRAAADSLAVGMVAGSPVPGSQVVRRGCHIGVGCRLVDRRTDRRVAGRVARTG